MQRTNLQQLIPQPKEYTLQDGCFFLTYKTDICLDAATPVECVEAARLLAAEVAAFAGFSPAILRRQSAPERNCIFLTCNGEDPGAEGYVVTVSPVGILVAGDSPAGLLYGVQTLRQLLRQYGLRIRCQRISDSPDLKARGLFYDVTRGRIPTMEFLKQLVDKCCFYKLNQLHLYIEHSFLFEGFSEIWRDDTPLTAEDILELDAYCCKRHVELVPSVATLGHLYEVLRSKSYHHLAEIEEGDAEFSFLRRMEHHTLDVTQEESLQLVYRMLDEYLPLFRSKLFNINGDEVFDLGKGRGKKLADQIGSHQMYVDWIGNIARYVKEKGRRPMFWGDVILEDPASIAALPEDIICMNWDYSPEYREDHAKKLAATGVSQYLCPGLQGWKQTINYFDDAYRNLHKMATLAHKYGGEGLLVTEWGDYGHLQDPEFAMPGIAMAGAMGWNKEIPDKPMLFEAISHVEYGDPTGRIMDFLAQLSRQAVFEWGHLVEYSEKRRGRIQEEGWDRFRNWYQAQIEERLPHAREMDEIILQMQSAISMLMRTMDQRQRMYPYLLMSEGQRLFNRYGLWIAGQETDKLTLAAELESWYLEYKKLWHRTSRESELYRIGEVIFWLADHLRES